jgi:low affinity Fe/Cu permease
MYNLVQSLNCKKKFQRTPAVSIFITHPLRKTVMKFSAISQSLSRWAGSARTFYAAVALILLWSLSGPYFHYNDTWQLIINTSTTIITFLMVFLIQNTQNRDNDILHIKIDELLRATKDAQNAVLSLDGLDRKQLEKLRKEYKTMGDSEETITVTTLTTERAQPKTDLNQA